MVDRLRALKVLEAVPVAVAVVARAEGADRTVRLEAEEVAVVALVVVGAPAVGLAVPQYSWTTQAVDSEGEVAPMVSVGSDKIKKLAGKIRRT
jgi:hypothetical protein